MLFTRDLRVRDNPALAAACAAGRVVPLFVLDRAILDGPFAAPNRVRFLLECLADLRGSLRELGGDLVVAHGDPAAEVARLAEETGADALFLADERSAYGTRRLAGLRRLGLDVSAHPGITVVAPGDLTPASGDHYRVFTPYWRAWEAARWRPLADVPGEVRLPSGVETGRLPRPPELVRGTPSPDAAPGGEREGRRRTATWLREDAGAYDDIHDDLAADRTSRLSPYIKFGCVSPRELAGAGPDAFRRQLAWRDFHHQVAAAFPALRRQDYRPHGQRWKDDRGALAAWCAGRTGIPIVDAGIRQLHREGFMHNRARLITASFLTRDLGIDWRDGLRHFEEWLTDGDIADNAGNWQWVAGTGNSTRPERVMNPLRQASRFDPRGDYVRRYVPEL
ncbi:cryptochrome/photolyase family protein, partial [Actinomadura welshii]